MKIALCDDEPVFRNQVKKLICEYNHTLTVYEFSNGKDLVNDKKKFDLVLLDIEMPEMDGMTAAKLIKKRNINTQIVFLSCHTELIYDAFKVRALRFLRKPLSKSDFFEALSQAEKNANDEEKVILTKQNRRFGINLKNIVLLEAYGDGTYLYDDSGEVYPNSYHLKKWEERLSEKGFFKIHRSYIVSLDYVRKIADNKVELHGVDKALTISRRNVGRFKEAYLKHIESSALIM